MWTANFAMLRHLSSCRRDRNSSGDVPSIDSCFDKGPHFGNIFLRQRKHVLCSQPVAEKILHLDPRRRMSRDQARSVCDFAGFRRAILSLDLFLRFELGTLRQAKAVVSSAPLETRFAGAAGGEIAEGPIEIL